MPLVDVNLLDGSMTQLNLSGKATGDDLLSEVCQSINLLEKDYFGLSHYDKKEGTRCWIQPDRKLTKQVKDFNSAIMFQVRFYPPDPSQLQEDLTRYQLCLQIQQDVKTGKLPCSFVTHALLGAYLVQSELGDYDPVDHGLTPDYIRDFDFAPNQSEDLLERIMEVHKTLKGQTPAEAELHYLDNAKKLAMYGVSLHPARDSEGVDIMLGVCSSGILVYRDRLRINRFAWPKIIKISYKRNGFFIKIRPGEFEHFESTIGFKLENHRAAKRLWKICVEHHSFFRLLNPEPKEKPKFPRFGSRFRYSGRTQHQAKKNNSMTERTNPAFERSGSQARTANVTSSQSMQGIKDASPEVGRNMAADEQNTNKRHTFTHSLPNEVHKELEDAQARRNARANDQNNQLHNDKEVHKHAVPVVPEPGTKSPMSSTTRPKTPPMSSMDRPMTNGRGQLSPDESNMSSYSPAYKYNQGPLGGGGRKSPLKTPEPMDYVTSSNGHNGAPYSDEDRIVDVDRPRNSVHMPTVQGFAPIQKNDPGIVDIDEALATDNKAVDIDDVLNNDPDSTFQYEHTTTETINQLGKQVVKETETVNTNLTTGETQVEGTQVIGETAGSPPDHVQAKSVTTRSGTYHENKETGASHATVESKTMAASVVTAKDGSQEEKVTTKQLKTEAASSTTTTRKESRISSSGVTDLDKLAASNVTTGDEYRDEGQIVSSQTITSKTRTVETTTYAIEKEGETETHVEQKVTIQSDGDPIDHDEALAQAIQEATAMNPDFTVEKIEINQTSQEE